MKSESPLRRNIVIFVFVAAIFAAPLASLGQTKGPANGNAFPLDQTLMGFKEQGVWYFLCIAPEYLVASGPITQLMDRRAAMSTAALFGAARPGGQALQNPQVPQDPY